MDIKSNYFKMDNKEFEVYLSEIKKSVNTISFFDGKFFFTYESNVINKLESLQRKVMDLDYLINSFSESIKTIIKKNMLVLEIKATNEIENIYTSIENIYSILNNASKCVDNKIISICNSYKLLFEDKVFEIVTLKDIRALFNMLFIDCISKEDLPDGRYFRKKPVFISDGIKTVHTGIINEKEIERKLEELITFYNSNENVFLKMILFHFLFEYVHPFYDGNGRIGRYLFSNGINMKSYSISKYIVSSSILFDKSKYYKAFKIANDRYQFGCLNEFVNMFIEILENYIDKLTSEIIDNKSVIEKLLTVERTKSEMKIFKFLCEASIYTTNGVSSQKIIDEVDVSKRTVIYALNKLREEEILVETKIGKYHFYKIAL